MKNPQVIAHRGQQRAACGQQLGRIRGRAQPKVRTPSNATSRPRATAASSCVTTSRSRIASWPICASPTSKRRAPAPSCSPISSALAESAPIDVLVEIKDPDAAARRGADDRRKYAHASGSSSAVSTGRRLPRSRQPRPTVQTSFMIGSVAGPEELVGLATAYRADGVHLCWEGAPRGRTDCWTAVASTDCVARAGNHTVARGTRRRVARARGAGAGCDLHQHAGRFAAHRGWVCDKESCTRDDPRIVAGTYAWPTRIGTERQAYAAGQGRCKEEALS